MGLKFFFFGLVLSALGAQQVRLLPSFIHRPSSLAWEIAEDQVGAEAVLNRALPRPGAAPMIWCARWLRLHLGLPDEITLLGDSIAAVPEAYQENERLVAAVGSFLRSESVDPDVVFVLEDFRLLDVHTDDGTMYSITRISGEKRFHTPSGPWVWRLRQGGSDARVRAKVQATLPFVRATRPMARGEQVTLATVDFVYANISTLGTRPLTAADLRTPWTAKSNIRAGDWLYPRTLVVSHSVVARLPVNVRVQRRGITVEVRGTALDSGMIGDRIRVRILDGEKTLQGVITAEGEVKVEAL